MLRTYLFRETGAHVPTVGWLFLDLNAYFASVEQKDRPEMRGKALGT